MRLLLDTHALLWWAAGDERLSSTARDVIADTENMVFVSTISAWELAIKVRQGKLSLSHTPGELIRAVVVDHDLIHHPVRLDHVDRYLTLPKSTHRDPFDHMLIAQALTDDLTLVSKDSQLSQYGCEMLW